ncbi:type II toxin-antitoxin system RelE/ParE family toxin [Candidatus Poribacteria bacterium]|nr:type II toxin-antitoxin system RelE/ParE family toxin [Candidatus Poribacteria bacterium]
MAFNIELSPAARRDLKRLPRDIQEEILFTHLPIIQADPYAVSGFLQGALKGELSYHFGRKPEYRIIYFIEGELITVTIIGKRENIYKRAKRRHR